MPGSFNTSIFSRYDDGIRKKKRRRLCQWYISNMVKASLFAHLFIQNIHYINPHPMFQELRSRMCGNQCTIKLLISQVIFCLVTVSLHIYSLTKTKVIVNQRAQSYFQKRSVSAKHIYI